MSIRLNYWQVAPGVGQALLGLEKYIAGVRGKTLDPELIELVKIRVSQINGCAYCLDMHTKDARAMGMTEQRIDVLNAWREAPFYSDAERAALAWAEALTSLEGLPIPDALFAQARAHFSEQALADLTLAICAINSWNRFALAFGADVGSYQPGQKT